ncbi:sortase [Candidatus Daviesbacteria bacterium]|nr:sortase [Candidatus Daviesbacteria bacterium]
MLLKSVSLILLGLGVFILMQVVLPFASFKIWELSYYDQSQALKDPTAQNVPDNNYLAQVLGVKVENINNFPAFISDRNIGSAPYSEFELSIPKLDLKDIRVLVSSDNFESNLAHLKGTALPGEKGNIFITGHSSLPLPFSAGKQKPFFVNLPNIKKGDEIILKALGQSYAYEVLGMRIVDPKDLSVINPPDSQGRYLSLMTCVPPGFNTKRLIVLARLKQS